MSSRLFARTLSRPIASSSRARLPSPSPASRIASTSYATPRHIQARFNSSSFPSSTADATSTTGASSDPAYDVDTDSYSSITKPVLTANGKVPKALAAFSMANKVCMVTGGARGLGYEFCKAFLDSGCTDLAILDLKEDEAQAAAEELIKAACGQFTVLLIVSILLHMCFAMLAFSRYCKKYILRFPRSFWSAVKRTSTDKV